MCGPRYAASPDADAERVLEQRAARQHRHGEGARHGDGPWARSRAHRRSTTGRPAMTRATESSQRASISRSCMRNSRRSSPRRVERLVVPIRERLFRQVARRHHQRPADVDAAAGDAAACTAARGRPAGCGAPRSARAHSPRACAPARSDARPRSAGAAPAPVSIASDLAGFVEVAHHHRERLLVATLAHAQALDGLGDRSRRTRGETRRAL